MPEPLAVLLVDDDDTDAQLIVHQLEHEYDVTSERVETADALHDALSIRVWDVVIADYSLPQFSASDALAVVRARGLDLPFIVITGAVGEATVVELMRGGVHDIVLRAEPARLLPSIARERAEVVSRSARRKAELALQSAHAALQTEHAARIAAEDVFVEGFVSLLDLRDKETEGHTRRVTQMTVRLARLMGIGNGELDDYRRGALLHDIGKMGVPDYILHKPGPLSDDERVYMQMHPIYAAEALRAVTFLAEASKIPKYHHEWWDGSGYPRGMVGEEIPLAARVFAVIDTFDALVSGRPYKAAWTVGAALAEIAVLSGTHFDPSVVDNFLRGMRTGALR